MSSSDTSHTGYYPDERRNFYDDRNRAPQQFDRRYEDPRYTDRRGIAASAAKNMRIVG